MSAPSSSSGHRRETLGTVILGVAASDAHAVANQLIAESLRLTGYMVVNLGVCTPLEEFADALDDYPDALAIAIGSVNGHAYDDLEELPLLRERGRLNCPVVIGGNLSVGYRKRAVDHARIFALGVDRILPDVAGLLSYLRELAARKPRTVLVDL